MSFEYREIALSLRFMRRFRCLTSKLSQISHYCLDSDFNSADANVLSFWIFVVHGKIISNDQASIEDVDFFIWNRKNERTI